MGKGVGGHIELGRDGIYYWEGVGRHLALGRGGLKYMIWKGVGRNI